MSLARLEQATDEIKREFWEGTRSLADSHLKFFYMCTGGVADGCLSGDPLPSSNIRRANTMSDISNVHTKNEGQSGGAYGNDPISSKQAQDPQP